MKNTLLYFQLLICFVSSAQNVYPDSSFSAIGRLETGVSSLHAPSKSVLLQPDGKYLVFGVRGVFPNQHTGLAKRFEPDGSPDPSFECPDSTLLFQTACLQADGKIVCATQNGLVRLHPNGALDSSFVRGLMPDLAHFRHCETAILPDGNIVSCGYQRQPSNEGFYVAMFKPNGSPDSSFAQTGLFKFHPTEVDLAFALDVQPDGKILVSGCAMSEYPASIALYRLLPNGSLDSTFGVNGMILETQHGGGEGFDLAIQPDGKILLAGYAYLVTGAKSALLRYHPNGAPDLSFGVQGACFLPEMERIGAILLRPDGKILVNGQSAEGFWGVLSQVLPNGNLDQNFGNNGFIVNDLPEGTYHALTIHTRDFSTVTTSRSVLNMETAGIVLDRFVLDQSLASPGATNFFSGRPLVFPNPITDYFTLEFSLSNPQAVEIELFDLAGKRLCSLFQASWFEAGQQRLSLHLPAALPSGQYVLTVTVPGKAVCGIPILK